MLGSEHLVIRLSDTSLEEGATVEQARSEKRSRERQGRRSGDDRLVEIEESS
jgi:hypothetical protein